MSPGSGGKNSPGVQSSLSNARLVNFSLDVATTGHCIARTGQELSESRDWTTGQGRGGRMILISNQVSRPTPSYPTAMRVPPPPRGSPSTSVLNYRRRRSTEHAERLLRSREGAS